MKKILLFLALFLSPGLAHAEAQSFDILNPKNLFYPGDVIIVRLQEGLENKDLRLNVLDKLYAFNKNRLAVVGISVDQKPGRYLIYLVETTEEGQRPYGFFYVNIEVVERQFREWYAGRVPSPQPARDVARKESIFSASDIAEDFTQDMYSFPLKDMTITDEFGNVRLHGRCRTCPVQQRISHVGLDLKAPMRTPVMAINSGRVLLAERFRADGNMVVIDHGSGVLSLYLHLSTFRVKAGDQVEKGQVIALSGNTGNVPPHLHFQIKVHGTNVDPLRFTEIANSVLSW